MQNVLSLQLININYPNHSIEMAGSIASLGCDGEDDEVGGS